MKRKSLITVITLVLVITMALGVFSGISNATTTKPPEPIPYNDEISYTENDDGTITVYKANTEITSATIPETINGKKVTRIGSFSSCAKLKTISIPNTVTSIKQAAFANCTSLESITIPDSVTTIEYEAFFECSALKNIKLPKNLKVIDSYTFYHCTSLKSIEIPNSVETIEWAAFEGAGLEKVVLPESVKTVSMWSFGYMDTLKEIYFPKGIESIYNTIDGTAFGDIPTSQLTIYGYKGTVAEEVANDLGYKFVARSEVPFSDIKTSDWYYNSVKYCTDNKIIYGTSDTTFSPNNNLTRANLVTILWRMEGSPKSQEGQKFSDVKSQEYYYDAVNWAGSKGIVNGYEDGKFRPNNNITREQLATILMNYARFKGKDTSSRADLSKFKDQNGISSYAKDSISWAVAKKVMSGKVNGTMADPSGTAIRAEAAAMIQNYCNYVGR